MPSGVLFFLLCFSLLSFSLHLDLFATLPLPSCCGASALVVTMPLCQTCQQHDSTSAVLSTYQLVSVPMCQRVTVCHCVHVAVHVPAGELGVFLVVCVCVCVCACARAFVRVSQSVNVALSKSVVQVHLCSPLSVLLMIADRVARSRWWLLLLAVVPPHRHARLEIWER
jgi:hypothetical protein